MRLGADELLQQAMSLPEDERIQIAEALLSSVAPEDDLPFDREWIDEVKRRSARIDAGQGKLSSWPEVRDRARRKAEEQVRG